MDNTAQKPNGASQVPAAPSGTLNKEVAPAGGDYVRPAPEISPIINDEAVREAGIQEVEQEIKVEEQHEEMGVRAEPAPVKTEPTGLIPPLMTPEEIKADLKKGPGIFNLAGHYSGIYIARSRDFLAVLLNKILRKPTNQPA